MKAIYINLDPYIAAFAAWIKAGKPGTAPHFDPLPLAVTIPLGETAAFLFVGTGAVNPTPTVDGLTIAVACASQSTGQMPPETEMGEAALQLSSIPGVDQYGYSPLTVSGDFTATYEISAGNDFVAITFTVLVRREQASGPVDLVDFTPPAAVTADAINAALGGTGAGVGEPLAGVKIDSTVLTGSIYNGDGEAYGYNATAECETVIGNKGGAS